MLLPWVWNSAPTEWKERERTRQLRLRRRVILDTSVGEHWLNFKRNYIQTYAGGFEFHEIKWFTESIREADVMFLNGETMHMVEHWKLIRAYSNGIYDGEWWPAFRHRRFGYDKTEVEGEAFAPHTKLGLREIKHPQSGWTLGWNDAIRNAFLKFYQNITFKNDALFTEIGESAQDLREAIQEFADLTESVKGDLRLAIEQRDYKLKKLCDMIDAEIRHRVDTYTSVKRTGRLEILVKRYNEALKRNPGISKDLLRAIIRNRHVHQFIGLKGNLWTAGARALLGGYLSWSWGISPNLRLWEEKADIFAKGLERYKRLASLAGKDVWISGWGLGHSEGDPAPDSANWAQRTGRFYNVHRAVIHGKVRVNIPILPEWLQFISGLTEFGGSGFFENWWLVQPFSFVADWLFRPTALLKLADAITDPLLSSCEFRALYTTHRMDAYFKHAQESMNGITGLPDFTKSYSHVTSAMAHIRLYERTPNIPAFNPLAPRTVWEREMSNADKGIVAGLSAIVGSHLTELIDELKNSRR